MVENTQRPFRIITHGNCTDGFFSAWIMKRYFNEILKFTGEDVLSSGQIAAIPIITAKPFVLQKEHQTEIEISEYDIVLDLPKPVGKKVFFWCDHHSSNEPKKDEKVDFEHHFEIADSNTGLLINLAIAGGAKLTDVQKEELLSFKEANDAMDMAKYSKEDIEDCYYLKKSLLEYGKDTASPLLKSHILSSFVHARDRYLTKQFLDFSCTHAANTQAVSPLSDESLWQLKPEQWHIARLTGHMEWREQFDTYVEFDEVHHLAIADKRKIRREYGLFDRFYVYLKFPKAIYNFNVKIDDDGFGRIGLGTNIFDKDARKIDVGAVLKETATLFGEGSGGGHAVVGGATVFGEKVDEALAFLKEKISEAHKK